MQASWKFLLEVKLKIYSAKVFAASISICESPIAIMLVILFWSIFSANLKKALIFHSLNPSK